MRCAAVTTLLPVTLWHQLYLQIRTQPVDVKGRLCWWRVSAAQQHVQLLDEVQRPAELAEQEEVVLICAPTEVQPHALHVGQHLGDADG
jgi:hypothetical protein